MHVLSCASQLKREQYITIVGLVTILRRLEDEALIEEDYGLDTNFLALKIPLTFLVNKKIYMFISESLDCTCWGHLNVYIRVTALAGGIFVNGWAKGQKG